MARPLLRSMAMSQPLVSLCMIVRDEVDLLATAIDSSLSFVDEIVVVDTGSTDGTRALARRRGAHVIDHPWSDDFAAARNSALAAASGRFVLTLDADEKIATDCPVKPIRESLSRSNEESFLVEIHDLLEGGLDRSYGLVRLFRNRPEHRYEGAFHEQIAPSIARRLDQPNISPPHSGLRLLHVGYTAQRRAARDKAERNLQMLRRIVEQDPEDVSARYFLARELTPIRGGRAVPGHHLDEALDHCVWLQRHRARLPRSLAYDLMRIHASALLAMDRPAEALGVLEAGEPGGACRDLLAGLAQLEAAEGAPEVVQLALEKIRGCFDRQDDGLPFNEPALTGAIARACAADALVRLGQLEEARLTAAVALGLPGGGARPRIALAEVWRASGAMNDALREYLAAVQSDPHDPWAWAGLGELLQEQEDPENAIRPLCNALSLAPGWNRVQRALDRARARAVG